MSGKIHVFLSNFSLFLTKPHSRDAVHDIAGMLLGILKSLKPHAEELCGKERFSMNCQSVLSSLLGSLTFFLAIPWGKYGALSPAILKKEIDLSRV